MEILKILEENGKSLYLEDLDFFETELATGGIYDDGYQAKCRKIIKEIRTWLRGDTDTGTEKSETPEETKQAEKKSGGGVFMTLGELAPEGSNPVAASLSPVQLIYQDIKAMRGENGYKTLFKKYVSEKKEIDADFVDAHYSFFQPWELDAIISVRQMPEEFLEKYFGALDHDKIARYQRFSESFFMKHYAQMNAEIVLVHGKNDWRKKENRSKQLDVFLRLKGVKQ